MQKFMQKKLCIFPYFLLTLLLASCSYEKKTPKDTIVTSVNTPLASLDPLFSTDANSQRINELIHAALVSIGEDLTPKAYLAEEIKLINDRTIAFKLKKKCRFHNGQEITLDDVEKSIRFFADSKNNSPFSAAFSKISKFTRTGDYSFQIQTEKVEPGLLTDLSLLKIIPVAIYDKAIFRNKPIGAGPYRVVKKTTSEILLERFDTGCFPQPASAKIHIKTVREELSRFLKLSKGELDVVLNDLDYKKIKDIFAGKVKKLNTIYSEGISFSYLGLNFSNAHLKKKKVRKAIYYALDISNIIKYKLAGMAKIATSVLSDDNFYSNKNLVPYKRDLKKARRLLDEASYFNGENNKEPLRLTLKTTTNKLILENAKAIVYQLKEVGIEVTHKSYDWGIFYADIKARNMEMYLLRWVGVTSPEILYDTLHSSQGNLNNRTNYKNSLMDAYLEKAHSTLNRDIRKTFYDKAQALFLEDLPWIPLWHNKNAIAYREEIKNVELHPAGSWSTFLTLKKE